MKNLLARLSPQSINKQPTFWRVPGRIAYIVNHSYPYSSNGYAFRTHGVATALVQHGHSVVVINRPGRPWDLQGFDNDNFPLHHEIDGVRYLHLREPSSKNKEITDYLNAAVEALKNILCVFKPSVVMPASNWENALPASIAAREIGLPFFYEVRGFWEISRISREPEWKSSDEYKKYVEMETAVAMAADRVFTLNRFMRDELVRRGVDGDKIDLVPNGYRSLPDLSKPQKLTKADLKLNTKYVVGYVGSFSGYEGLDDLVRACAELRKQGVDLSLLLVGSFSPVGIQTGIEACPASSKLRQLAQELRFDEHLYLPGRVAPDTLAEYYAMIDLVVIPRKQLSVCDLVSPIKPIEAAAYGKPVLLSAVKPNKLLADECSVFSIFDAENIIDLTTKIKILLINKNDRLQAKMHGPKWVLEHRLFSFLVEQLSDYLNKLSHQGSQTHAVAHNKSPINISCIALGKAQYLGTAKVYR